MAASIGAFDGAALNKLAARIRQDEQATAGAAAFHSAHDPSRQPKLSFKAFSVAKTKVAVSPDCSYRLLKEALDGAKRSITAYVYNISAKFVFDTLRLKAQAGIKVRVMVDANDPADTSSGEFKKLKALGIDVALAPSTGARKVFTVCHQKYVVVDGKVTVIASANWAGTALPPATQPGQYRAGNREWMARVDDVDAARWFEQLFDADWKIPATGAGLAAAAPAALTAALQAEANYTAPGKLFDIFDTTNATKVLPLISPVNYRAEIKRVIDSAKQRIWIQQQYITAGDGVNELLGALHARSATCDVRIIVSPKYAAAWDNTLKTLRAAGLVSRLRAQNLEHVIHCHNKGLIVDDSLCVVSSTNWSENSITRAREAGLLIQSRDITAYFADVFDLDWSESLSPAAVSKSMITTPAADMH